MIREYTRPSPILNILVEHIEEAAFMYNCRCRALTDAERSWEDLFAYEKRMVPHAHGLALGGLVSARLLKEKLTLDEDGDPGESFVAAMVYPMLDLVEPMQWLTETLAQRPPHFRALLDGLKHTFGRGIEGWLACFLDHENPTVRGAGAEVAGYRGLIHLQDKIMSMQKDPDVSMIVMVALASMGVLPERHMVGPFINAEEPYIAMRAYELLLKIGDNGAVDSIREKTRIAEPFIDATLAFYLSVSGTLADDQVIRDIIQAQPQTQVSCLLALGLCGNINSISFLIDHLKAIDDPDVYTAAYQGLRLITGMDYLPQFDLDEADPERVLEYQGLWQSWWEQNSNKFSAEIKWRRGKRLSPKVLVQDLTWPGNPCRNYTYLEAVVRYGCPVNFQHDQLYAIQAQQLQKVMQWADKENDRFKAGLCYYHGGLLS